MPASTGVIFIEQGADWLDPMVCLTDTGTPVDLTGSTIVLEAKISITDTLPWLKMDTATPSGNGLMGGFVVGGSNGVITPNLPGTVTRGLDVSGILGVVGPVALPIDYVDAQGRTQTVVKTGYPLVCQIERKSGLTERIFDGTLLLSLEVAK